MSLESQVFPAYFSYCSIATFVWLFELNPGIEWYLRDKEVDVWESLYLFEKYLVCTQECGAVVNEVGR